MNHKKFMDIQRAKQDNIQGFEKGDTIVIQEKIDGANASIRYDPENNCVVAQSRKQILSETNTLRGFYEWSQKLSVDKIRLALGNNLVLYGEWLVSHSVPYPKDRYSQFYAYDIYDTQRNCYCKQSVVKTIVEHLGINYVPVFYIGEFVDWETCNSYVGKTKLGGEYGEGIVIKNQSKINNPKEQFYLKVVCEKFSEVSHNKKPKEVDLDKLKTEQQLTELCSTVITVARVRKELLKMVDENIIPATFGFEQMGIIAKDLFPRIVADCKKEEPSTFAQISDLKFAYKFCIQQAKEIIKNERI